MFNHRPYCRKEGRCIKCGRYICEGCNAIDETGHYGICIACNAKEMKFKGDVKLPFRPLIKPKNIERYTNTVNDRFSEGDTI